jgi:hypothetical protein
MTYELTVHARDVMQKRGINEDWLERALDAPGWREVDNIDTSLEHYMVAIPEFGDRVLRVIINPHVDPVRVITMYFDRRVRGVR